MSDKPDKQLQEYVNFLLEDEIWDDAKHGTMLQKTQHMQFMARQDAAIDKRDKQKKALKIENPNSSGQGKSGLHQNHKFHDTLTKAGYQYSHTTPVGDTESNFYTHHTYTHPKPGTPAIGVSSHPKRGESWSGGHLGSGRKSSGIDNSTLAKYAKGAINRVK